jgi:hypothetical protein
MCNELSKKLQTKHDPQGVICLIIMRLALHFLEELPNHILTLGDPDRVEREMSAWLAVITFYAHSTMVLASQRLTAVQLDCLQTYITTVVSNAAVSFYHPSCSEEAKQDLTDAATKTLNEGITEYVYAMGVHGVGKNGSETKLLGLVSRAGSDVAKACGRPNDVAALKAINELLFAGCVVIVEQVKLDELLMEI